MAEAELAPGERLAWAERRQRRPRSPWARIAVGIVFTAVAAIWTVGALEIGTVPALLGVPFVIVGLALLTGRLGRARAVDTVYAVSDRRLLVIEEGRTRRVRSIMPDEIDGLVRTERADGSGDLVVRHDQVLRDDLRLRRDDPPGPRLRTRRIGFFDVPRVREAEAAAAALRRDVASGDQR